jgi:NAD(P)-dependent dehydrogenase (short-subunit alcohol dehydrogenase family)
MSADGKVVVVTGGSGGSGETVALRLSRDGYRGAVVASSRFCKAEKVAALIRAEGGDANGFARDVRDAQACELGRENINVNCVAPGNTATGMNEDIRNDPGMQGLRDFMVARTPSNSTFSEPQDVAWGHLVPGFRLRPRDARQLPLMDEGISAGL